VRDSDFSTFFHLEVRNFAVTHNIFIISGAKIFTYEAGFHLQSEKLFAFTLENFHLIVFTPPALPPP